MAKYTPEEKLQTALCYIEGKESSHDFSLIEIIIVECVNLCVIYMQSIRKKKE